MKTVFITMVLATACSTAKPQPITMFFHITPEELETEYEKVD
jgi:hypothetical protein